MNRWFGTPADSARQSSDRDQRAARRTIARLPEQAQLPAILSDEDEFLDTETSFHLNLDGEPGDTSTSSQGSTPEAATMPAVAFDVEDKENDADSWKKEVKIKFDMQEVEYWFNSVEAQMKSFGINKQWDKKNAILPLLSESVIDECKPLLRLSETDAGNQIYKELKTEIIALYGSKDEDAYQKAKALKLGTGRPSALGKKLVHALCPGTKPFTTCHCARIVYGFWIEQMSPQIKTKLAGQKFTKDTYKEMFKLADDAWEANGGTPAQPAVIAAIAAPPPVQVQTTSSEDAPQVAAFRQQQGRGRGGRGGRGNRGGRGGNRGGGNSSYSSSSSSSGSGGGAAGGSNQNANAKPHQKGPKHPDLPSSAGWACAQHWKKGRSAPYCSDPTVCQWNNVYVPRT